MGMFDYLNYEGKQYQTKDTPQQTLEDYEIRGNELWWRKSDDDISNILKEMEKYKCRSHKNK